MSDRPPAAVKQGRDRKDKKIVVTGVPVAPGLAVGTAYFHESDVDVPILSIDEADVKSEQNRLAAGIRKVKKQLAEMEEEFAKEVGARDARIFAVQGLLLDDPAFRKAIRTRIGRDLVNAEVAVRDEFQEWIMRLEAMSVGSDRDPAADLRDVGRQLVRALAGKRRAIVTPDDGVERMILVTQEFLPTDTAHVHRESLAAIVTASGGVASHAAILARNLGIPAVTGVDVSDLPHRGRRWVVDGSSGQVIVNPTEGDVHLAEERSATYHKLRADLKAATTGHAHTRDDVAIEIMLNVEHFDELSPADLNDLTGIGLYRTEFLYMNRPAFPTEEEQYQHYGHVLAKVGGREVTFRTIDVGGDKPLPYLSVPHEPNPVLGWRGIRLSLEWPDMFYSQLRALLRASVHGNMRILLPMVTMLEEVERTLSIIEEIRDDLVRRGVAVADHVPLGAMIEVPAAALATRSIAEKCDFISIGTNDLSQYALAVDRNNARVAGLYQQLHPGMLNLLRMILESADAAQTPVCLCGELAGDPEAVLVLLGLGLRSFSMSPFALPAVKRLIGSVDLDLARKVTQEVLALNNTVEIRRALREHTLAAAPELESLLGREP